MKAADLFVRFRRARIEEKKITEIGKINRIKDLIRGKEIQFHAKLESIESLVKIRE